MCLLCAFPILILNEQIQESAKVSLKKYEVDMFAHIDASNIFRPADRTWKLQYRQETHCLNIFH